MKFELPLEVYILGLILALAKGSFLGWFTTSFFNKKNERNSNRKPEFSQRLPNASATRAAAVRAGKSRSRPPTGRKRRGGAASGK